jgi:hypothetical protein
VHRADDFSNRSLSLAGRGHNLGAAASARPARHVHHARARERAGQRPGRRTGHTTSRMINRYLRQARQAEELGMQWLEPLDEVIPELVQFPRIAPNAVSLGSDEGPKSELNANFSSGGSPAPLRRWPCGWANGRRASVSRRVPKGPATNGNSGKSCGPPLVLDPTLLRERAVSLLALLYHEHGGPD